jgi:cytochrome c5
MKNLLTLAIASILVAGSSQLFAGEGEDLYKSKCATCHAAGVAGAPILGNKEQWAPRIAKGMDALMETALKGSKVNPAMLPKGGFSDLTDGQIKEIVTYMVNSSK